MKTFEKGYKKFKRHLEDGGVATRHTTLRTGETLSNYVRENNVEKTFIIHNKKHYSL